MKPPAKNRAKSKRPPKAKTKPPADIAPQIAIVTGDDRRAARNVAQVRDKLTAALDDPMMREQIVRAMRGLIYEDKG